MSTARPQRLSALRFALSPEALGQLGPVGRYGCALAILATATLLAQALYMLTGSNRVGGAWQVGVLVTAYLLGSGPGYLSAAVSFLIYNLYVGGGHLGLPHYRPEDILVLVTFPTVALLTGSLTGRVRDEARRARARALTTAVLFEATREFSASDDPDLIRARLAEHLAAASHGRAFVLDGEALFLAGSAPPAAVMSAARALGHDKGAEARTVEADGWRVRHLAGGAVAAWSLDPRAGAEEAALLQILADAGAATTTRAALTVAKAEAEARARTEDLRNALLSSISHDLRTPLAAVLASATSLQEFGDKFDAKTRHDLTTTIQEEAERLNAFVTNLLNMTRLEGGALDPSSSAFDLAEVVERTKRRFERLRGKRKIACALDDAATVALGDPVLFEVALANVLENAIRYSLDGGLISLKGYPREDQVVIEVTDEGPGVPEAELPRLFEKFYRGSAAKRTPGTGLGLSIVRGVMQGMGGQASATLRSDARSGMVMSLALPAVRM